MVRWIAFDDDTAEAVVSRLRRGAAEIRHSLPVDAALRTDGSAILVLPSPTPGKLLMARFTPRERAPQLPSPEKWPENPFAGTTLAMRKPVTSDKKPWWRNIVA